MNTRNTFLFLLCFPVFLMNGLKGEEAAFEANGTIVPKPVEKLQEIVYHYPTIWQPISTVNNARKQICFSKDSIETSAKFKPKTVFEVYDDLKKVCTEHSGQIVGGKLASEGAWPWMAKLLGSSLCGGTLIHPGWILTAAHCFHADRTAILGVTHHQVMSFRFAGRSKGQYIKIDKFIKHPRWDHRYVDNDIALVKLKTFAKLTDTVKLACIRRHPAVQYNSSECYVTGWGSTDHTKAGISSSLKELHVRVASYRECSAHFAANNVDPRKVQLSENHLCAFPPKANTAPCFGDSGGPIQCLAIGPGKRHHAVVAVLSAVGNDCNKDKGSELPAFTMNIYKYIDWIKEVISKG